MAITTLDGIVAGFQKTIPLYKVGTPPEAVGLPHSWFYTPGMPGAAVAPSSGVNGAALTSVSGQIPYANPGAGNGYLGRLAGTVTQSGLVLLCDRLWDNSGLSVTSTSSQGLTSAAWPARDLNGSTDGEGVLVGLEFSATGGAGTPTCTLGYTDQSGNAGATATFVGVTTTAAGTFYMWPLAAGDTGVRSVETFQQSATWSSGTHHLVAYRVLAVLPMPQPNGGVAVDVVTGGLVRLYDNTVPFLIWIPSVVTTPNNFTGTISFVHG